MARVEDWFDDFALRHTERFPREWPAPRSEFWDSLLRRFIKHGVQEADADAASEALMDSPPAFVDRHPEALLAKVREFWAAAKLADSPPDDADAAKAASRACPHCGGSGLATVYRRSPRGQGAPSCSSCGEVLPADHLACPQCVPGARRVPPSVAAHCVCPYGRWMRARLAKDDALSRIMPDLGDVLSSRSRAWSPEPPGLPLVPPDAFDAWAALKHLVACHRAEPAGPRAAGPRSLSPDEAAFAARLDAVRAARFGALDPVNRGLVMRAVGDPALRDVAAKLIGPRDAPGGV